MQVSAGARGLTEGATPENFTLETLFTSPLGSDVDTATAVQLAGCRILDGNDLGALADDPDVLEALGGNLPALNGVAPRLFLLLAGIRCGKSMLIADKAIHLARTCYVGPPIRPSDDIRVPIVSVEVDNAKATFQHVVRTIQNSPVLSNLLVGEPKADSVRIRHESGRDVEIKVVALSRAGSTLMSRWFPGVIFDEAPLMGGSIEYVKNLDEALTAIHGRVLPGGTIMLVGSAEGRTGPVYDLFKKHFGQSGPDAVVMLGTGPKMNPVYYTPERCAELERVDERAYRKNVLCEFVDPEEQPIDELTIERCTRKEQGDRKPIRGHDYTASMDPATRKNSWTFGIIGCSGERRYYLALVREWRPKPGERLSPKAILSEIAALGKPYGITMVISDQYMGEALQDIASDVGLVVVPEDLTGANRLELFNNILGLLLETHDDGVPGLELARDPLVKRDLLAARKRVTTAGTVALVLPESPDGRHCDNVPMLMLGMKYPPSPPDLPANETHLDPLDEMTTNQESPHERYGRALRRVAG